MSIFRRFSLLHIRKGRDLCTRSTISQFTLECKLKAKVVTRQPYIYEYLRKTIAYFSKILETSDYENFPSMKKTNK